MLEKMDEFFTARADGYEEQMINNVVGCAQGYRKMADLLPADTKTVLDLGCGTGLELDEIFKTHLDVEATGVDLTQAMLDKLARKHPDKKLKLIKEDYFEYDFGVAQFDAVISFETMHHFDHDAKLKLYSKILSALNAKGQYIECDYMVLNQEEENFYFSENKRIRQQLNISENEIYHFDTPCTVDNQIKLFLNAGFSKAEKVFREGNTTIIVACK